MLTNAKRWERVLAVGVCLVWMCLGGESLRAVAAELTPENLPADTYLYVAVKEVDETLKTFKTTPWGKLIESPEFEPFWKDSLAKFNRKLTQPLEKELKLHFKDYAGIFDGPLVMALIPSTNRNVLLNDSCVVIAQTSKGRERLVQNLADLAQKWKEAGLEVGRVTVEEVEFYQWSIPREVIGRLTEQMGAPEGSFLARGTAVERNLDVWVGVAGSQIIVALGDLSVAQKVIQAEAGKLERLKSLPAYVEERELLKNGLAHVWMQPPPVVSSLYQVLAQAMDALEEQTAAAGKKLNPFFPNLAQLLRALHLESVSSVGVSTTVTRGGLETRFHIACPVSKRAGLTQLLNAARNEDCRAPDFVPLNALSCTRMRVDLPKAWGILDSISNDAYPLKELLFLGFEQGYQREVPQISWGEDVLKRLGSDVVFYEMPAPATSQANPTDGVYLIGSPEPEALLETLVELYSHTRKAIGFDQPYTLQKQKEGSVTFYVAEPTAQPSSTTSTNSTPVAWPRFYLVAHAGYVGYSTSEACIRALCQYEPQSSEKKLKGGAPLVLFREENSLEEARIFWNQLVRGESNSAGTKGEVQRTVSKRVLPFPLNRLNYQVLPPFEDCSAYLCPATLFSLFLTPQGLDGTLLKVFP